MRFISIVHVLTNELDGKCGALLIWHNHVIDLIECVKPNALRSLLLGLGRPARACTASWLYRGMTALCTIVLCYVLMSIGNLRVNWPVNWPKLITSLFWLIDRTNFEFRLPIAYLYEFLYFSNFHQNLEFIDPINSKGEKKMLELFWYIRIVYVAWIIEHQEI